MELYLLNIDTKKKTVTLEVNQREILVKYWGNKTNGYQGHKWAHNWAGSKKELEELDSFIDEILWNYV